MNTDTETLDGLIRPIPRFPQCLILVLNIIQIILVDKNFVKNPKVLSKNLHEFCKREIKEGKRISRRLAYFRRFEIDEYWFNINTCVVKL